MKWIILVILVLARFQAEAATLHVRNYSVTNSVPSANTGLTWTDCITNWTGLSGTWGRNTYYFSADEDWRTGASWRIDPADSGTNLIVIKFSTLADHGSSVGWQDAYATNGPAKADHWVMDTDNWRVIGGKGYHGSNDLDYVPYNVQFRKLDSVANDYMILLNNGNGPVTNGLLQQLEIFSENTKGQTNPPWQPGIEAIQFKGRHSWITLSNVYVHNESSGPMLWSSDNSTNYNLVLARNGIGQVTMNFVPNDHSELVEMDSSTNWAYQNFIFEDARSSAFVFFINPNTNGCFVGGQFRYTGFWNLGVEVSDSTFLIDGNPGPSDYINVAQCTFFNIPYGNLIGSSTGFLASNHCHRWNCVVVNCTRIDNAAFDNSKRWSSIDHDSYFGSGTQSEAGIENLASSPLNGILGGGIFDLRLSRDTAARDASQDATLPAGSLVDANGNAFTTSRGAFQFVSAPPPPVVVLPLNVRVVGH